ncbi:MAG: hypothetical protein MUE61_01660 [Vicinamibacterales bacterium]|jgi:hypothetical protein|nr:hypothetical protein [Vicinamibacterales bacterium]
MRGITAWEDDPLSSSAAAPVERPVPDLSHPGLGLSVVGRQPAAQTYPRGTAGFRYWSAADSLARAVGYWRRVVPGGLRWHTGRPLVVDLDAGNDLNAYYDRQELCFFHAEVRGVTVYSGESPDVLCHELGHALLDAIRPQIWNAASIEVASFHESFGDISAILSALELRSLRDDVLANTGGRLARSSRVSRLAEQLGWAIRQSHPDAVDADCLRNAVNSFFYRQPESLPPMAPASALSSEPHSFSRVFTAAWLESLAGMAEARGTGAGALASAALDAGRLLVAAVGTARIASNYYAQIAAGLLAADERLMGGEFRAAIRRAFVGRGILAMSSAAAIAAGTKPRGAGQRGRRPDRLPTIDVPVDGRAYGLRLRRLLVEAPLGATRWSASSAALDLGPLAPATPDRASRAFVEDLLRRGRVDTASLDRRAADMPRGGRTTHVLVREGRRVRLARRLVHARPGA